MNSAALKSSKNSFNNAFYANRRRYVKTPPKPKPSRAMKIHKFCCCFSLEFGAFVIGVVRLIWASVDGFSKITGGFSMLFNECECVASANKSTKAATLFRDLR
jgi:hypothetical protein